MRRRLMILMMAAIPLAGCAANRSGSGEAPVLRAACKADSAQQFIGQKVTEGLGAEILQVTGARTLRWGPPRSAWTMDYRSDRVGVSYDDAMVVQQISCG